MSTGNSIQEFHAQRDAAEAGVGLRPMWALFLAGVLAVAVYFGVAEFVAGLYQPESAPLLVLGRLVITIVPTVLIKTAIAIFGTHDKFVLILTVWIVGMLIGGAIGRLGERKRAVALVVFSGLGILPIILLLTAGGPVTGALPSLLGVAAGIAAYLGLFHLIPRLFPPASTPATGTGGFTPVDGVGSRRGFIGLSAALGVISVAAIATGRSVSTLAKNAGKAMADFVLPAAATSAPAIPEGAELDLPGISPLMTPNDEFYRIDTALIPPSVDPADWSLRIHGMVAEEVTITMAELLDLPMEEHRVTLTCVSNQVGGELIGNALWLGYPVRELLARAKPAAGADMVLSHSHDGFTASTPLEVLTDDRAALVAVGMNGEPLPLEHGFPVRLVVPGLYGFVSATKWVTELEVTRFADQDAYWTRRGWSSHGPVLVSSRVDVPRAGASVDAGEVVTGGMAWAQHSGIEKVEVRLDNGEWQSAELGEELDVDTWRQWRAPFSNVQAGPHTVTVRATDKAGNVQIAENRPPIPGSATGLHSRDFRVG